MAKPIQQRLFTWCWRRPWFRREMYNFLAYIYRRQTSWRMMNCGHRSSAPPPALPAEMHGEQYCYELYGRLVEGTAIAGRDVLEVGAGRGGGARYLHDTLGARRVVALDHSPSTTRWCRRHLRVPGVDFVCGNAALPPFPEASFDAVIAVEVTHCLPDKDGFLAGAARVLRPGGRLLVADFFYRRPDAMHALGKFEAAVDESAFTRVFVDDWTPQAVAAIEADSDRRGAIVRESLPWFCRDIALNFASTTSSSTYAAMLADRTVYRRYVLERRAPAG